MKKILFYIAALTLSVGCTETMIDEPTIEATTTSSEKVFATLNLDINGGESDTRVSVDTSADTWKLAWEDGDVICVYSIAQKAFTNLTYVADGNSGGTFSGDVYPGENRIYYLSSSYLSTSTYDDVTDTFVFLYSREFSEETMYPTMISSEVINVEVTDDDGDGIVTDTFDITMQQVCTAINFKMTFTGIPDDIALSLDLVEVGVTPDGATDGEYVDLPSLICTYPEKSVDASDFVYSTYYGGFAGSDISIDIANDTEYSMQFSVLPFTFESGQKLQVTLTFNDGFIEKTFDFTNSSGADVDFPRATYTTLSKSYDLSGISDDIDAIFAGTWAADAVAFADTTSAGTESDPIEIASEQELAYLARVAMGVVSGQSTEGTYYKLTKDLDLADNQWYPIGDSSQYFMGHFDGDNHTISNLTIDSTEDYQGLFGYVYSGSISNLKMKDVDVIGGLFYVSSISGRFKNSSISDCSIEGGSVTGGSYTGGVVGYLGTSNMIRCYNEGASVYGDVYTGGVVGRAWGSSSASSSVSECYNTGVCSFADMNSTSSTMGVGGVVGSAGYYTTVTRCYNTGDINGIYAFGGVVGQLSSQGVVVACYNTGVISETSIITSSVAGSANGGIVGLASVSTSTLSACYDASQSQYMVGYTIAATAPFISSCYCLSPTVLTNPDYGSGTFATDSVNCAQLSDLAALNAKVADMNAAANTALGTTDVSYFTADDTNTYLPSLIGEAIKYEDTDPDPVEDFTYNGKLEN